MKFFKGFKPKSERSPIDKAMESRNAIHGNPDYEKIYDAVVALPDEERALVVDLMRALPKLTESGFGAGTVTLTELECFIDDPHKVQRLQGIMNLQDVKPNELREIGNAIFIPDMNEEAQRELHFGTKEGERKI